MFSQPVISQDIRKCPKCSDILRPNVNSFLSRPYPHRPLLPALSCYCLCADRGFAAFYTAFYTAWMLLKTSDVKRGQNLEAEARATRPRPGL